MLDPALLNEAIPLYLGRSDSSFPDPGPERLVTRFEPALRDQLQQRIDPILQELYDMQPDWDQHSGLSGTEWAVSRLREAHGFIDEKAAEALFWAYSFWNRGIFFKELDGERLPRSPSQ